MRSGGLTPTILNAANEIAVEAFLDRRIAFYDIPQVVEATLAADGSNRIGGRGSGGGSGRRPARAGNGAAPIAAKLAA